MAKLKEPDFVSTQNPCKVCTPFGAALAFAGIEGAVPLLHGSQGCSTYIRRYLIGHFREPMDIASSNFHESAAIFGGKDNLFTALRNVIKQYSPKVIGVATTCLAETIGDDIRMLIREFSETWKRDNPVETLPEIIPVSTPSYQGTHSEGFHAAVTATIAAIAEGGTPENRINILPGMVSPADLRHLREIVEDFGMDLTLLPDYSDTLDGPAWDEYHRIPEGGTALADIRAAGRAQATVEFTTTQNTDATGGAHLGLEFNVPRCCIPMPIGLRQSDLFFQQLERIAKRPAPERYLAQRGRLVDSYVDGHKYLFEKRAVVYGEEDLVVGLVSMLAEIGVTPVLCASGGKSGKLRESVEAVAPDLAGSMTIVQDVDFMDIERQATDLAPDVVIGNSNGFKLAKELDCPLLRVGLPIHDRIGAARVRHLGYEGAQEIFDRLVNLMIEAKQNASPVGYTHM